MDIKAIVTNEKVLSNVKTIVKNKWFKRSLIAIGAIVIVKKIVDARVDDAEARFNIRPPQWFISNKPGTPVYRGKWGDGI